MKSITCYEVAAPTATIEVSQKPLPPAAAQTLGSFVLPFEAVASALSDRPARRPSRSRPRDE